MKGIPYAPLFGVLSPEICMQFRRETAQIALLTWGEGDSGIRSTNSGGTKKLLNQKSTNNHMYLCIYLAYIYINLYTIFTHAFESM